MDGWRRSRSGDCLPDCAEGEYVNSTWPHWGGLSWPHLRGCGRGGCGCVRAALPTEDVIARAVAIELGGGQCHVRFHRTGFPACG